MAGFELPTHGRFSGAHRGKRAALVPERLDLVPELLSGLGELSVPSYLGFGTFNNKLGSIGSVIGYQFFLLNDLLSQGCNKVFLLELNGDAVRACAGLLEKIMCANFSISCRIVASAACRMPDVPSPEPAAMAIRMFPFAHSLSWITSRSCPKLTLN